MTDRSSDDAPDPLRRAAGIQSESQKSVRSPKPAGRAHETEILAVELQFPIDARSHAFRQASARSQSQSNRSWDLFGLPQQEDHPLREPGNTSTK